jgi:hypothetical protein
MRADIRTVWAKVSNCGSGSCNGLHDRATLIVEDGVILVLFGDREAVAAVPRGGRDPGLLR